MKRLAVVVTLTAVATLAPGSAEAVKPARSCPASFTGPLTYAEIIAQFPPPPEVPDPIAVLVGIDANTDGSLCVRPLPPSQGDAINIVDNVSNSQKPSS